MPCLQPRIQETNLGSMCILVHMYVVTVLKHEHSCVPVAIHRGLFKKIT